QHVVAWLEAGAARLDHLAHALVPGVAGGRRLGRRVAEHSVQVRAADGRVGGPQQDLAVRDRRHRHVLAHHTSHIYPARSLHRWALPHTSFAKLTSTGSVGTSVHLPVVTGTDILDNGAAR